MQIHGGGTTQDSNNREKQAVRVCNQHKRLVVLTASLFK